MMSTVLRPVGPEPAGVYWKRRLVLIASLAVVVLVVWLLATGGSSAEPKGGADKDAKPATSTTKSAAPASTDCPASALRLSVVPSKTSYAKGQKPSFAISIMNAGTSGCMVDAGDRSREVRIVSGNDRVWSSRDCPASAAASRNLLLRAGAKSPADLTWDRVRSDAACSKKLPTPKAGTYKVQVFLLGAKSDAVTFSLQ